MRLLDNGFTMIDFVFEDPQHGRYVDSLMLEPNHNYTMLEIEDLKRQRFENWLAHLEETKNSTLVAPHLQTDQTII